MHATFRPGTAADAPVCGRICYEAFKAIAEQHNFPPDFPSAEIAIGLYAMILGRSDIFSIVGERDGHIVCSNFLWEGDAIAGVGPITVLPAAQNASLGRQLMQSVLDHAESRRQVGVRLVQAAYHNRSLSVYTKLGFHAREPLSTLQSPPLKMELSGYRVRHTSQDDLRPAMTSVAWCMVTIGTVRLPMLLSMRRLPLWSTVVGLPAMPQVWLLWTCGRLDKRRTQGSDRRCAGLSRPRLPLANAEYGIVPMVLGSWSTGCPTHDAHEPRAISET